MEKKLGKVRGKMGPASTTLMRNKEGPMEMEEKSFGKRVGAYISSVVGDKS